MLVRPTRFGIVDAVGVAAVAVVFGSVWLPLWWHTLLPLTERAVGRSLAGVMTLFLAYDFPLMVALLPVAAIRRISPRDVGLYSESPLWHAASGAASSGAVLGAVWFFAYLAGTIWPETMSDLARTPEEGGLHQTIQELVRAGPWRLLGAVCVAGLVGPVIEEVYFRGMVYQAVRLRFRTITGAAVSALLFAVFHVQSGMLFVTLFFLLGIVLAVLFETRRSLIPCIAFHAVQNCTAILLHLVDA